MRLTTLMTASPQLPGVLGSLGPVLNHYGYLAVAGFIALEDFGIPLPGETVLIAAAVYAGAGKLNVVLLGVVAVAAAVLGDNVGFAIGHFGGRRLVLRFGKYVFLTERRLDKAEDFVGRHGGKIVTIARFVEGLRQANGIVAGVTGMAWLRFLAFNVLGAVLWVWVWLTLGYVAGDHIGTVYEQIHKYSRYVAIAVAVLVLALIVRAVVRHRRGSGTDETRREGRDARAGR